MIESITYRHTFVRKLVCHCIIFLPPTCRKEVSINYRSETPYLDQEKTDLSICG